MVVVDRDEAANRKLPANAHGGRSTRCNVILPNVFVATLVQLHITIDVYKHHVI